MENEKSEFDIPMKRVLICWLVSGLIGSVMAMYPDYKKERKINVAILCVSVAGPAALIVGMAALDMNGYTTIKLKD